jgi:hypothetical protein
VLRSSALALCLILAPTLSPACQGHLYTYDFADPGAEPHPDRVHLKYFFGRIVDVKAIPATDRARGNVLVIIEIIKDYRYPSTYEPVQAWTETSMCWWTPKIGYVAKFAVDERQGRPGHLVRAKWYF